MATPRKFFHDRLILLLLTINVFLVMVTVVLVLLRLEGLKGGGYIVEYRASLGLNAFKRGDGLDLLAFPIFSAAVLALYFFISHKIYPIRRHIAVTALSLSLLLLVLSLIVSNALLVLR